MLIRAGYTLVFECDAATPLMAMLTVRPSRHADLRMPHRLSTGGAFDREDYRDAFGNIRIRPTRTAFEVVESAPGRAMPHPAMFAASARPSAASATR